MIYEKVMFVVAVVGSAIFGAAAAELVFGLMRVDFVGQPRTPIDTVQACYIDSPSKMRCLPIEILQQMSTKDPRGDL